MDTSTSAEFTGIIIPSQTPEETGIRFFSEKII
jgi:hypothetical protein